MALPALALGLSAGLGAVKAFTGISQGNRAERIRKSAQREMDANPFRTPAEAMEALSSSRTQAAQTTLPGESIFTDQLKSATGGAMEATRDAAVTPQDIIGAATRNYQSLYVNPLRQLRVSAAERYDKNQGKLRNQLNNVAGYREKEWNQNVLRPYQNAMSTAGQLAGAGQQNTFSGLSDIAGGVANFGLSGGFGGDEDDINKLDSYTGVTSKGAISNGGISNTLNLPTTL